MCVDVGGASEVMARWRPVRPRPETAARGTAPRTLSAYMNARFLQIPRTNLRDLCSSLHFVSTYMSDLLYSICFSTFL